MDPFTSALIANTDRLKHRQRELGAMSIELKKKPYDILKLHQRVKIKLRHNPFRKETIFQPAFSNHTHTITDINKSSYPAVYTLTGTQKKFYSYQLLPVGDGPELDHLMMPTQTNQKLLIQTVLTTPPNSLLRSGKARKLPSSIDDVKYKVLQNGEIKLLSRNDLRLHKNLFNENHLVYSPFFNEPQNRKYIV